jgi:hypothetical protein
VMQHVLYSLRYRRRMGECKGSKGSMWKCFHAFRRKLPGETTTSTYTTTIGPAVVDLSIHMISRTISKEVKWRASPVGKTTSVTTGGP